MIIFTLDALADDSHRRPLIDCKPFAPNWEAYNAACDGDKPVDPVLEILYNLWKNEVDFQIWSERCESVKEKTLNFLFKHCYSFSLLYSHNPEITLLKMRPIGDDSPQEELFARWYDELFKNIPIYFPSEDLPIEMVFSSHKPTIEMFRRRGVFVFDCGQGDK